MNTEHDWTVWWNNEGSGMRPLNGQDNESHVRDMTRIAWLNGAFGSADKIERLRAELADAYSKSAQVIADLSSNLCTASAMERERLTAERDEARRRTNSILTEIDCRIEHGAESNGHLEVLRDMFKENTDE